MRPAPTAPLTRLARLSATLVASVLLAACSATAPLPDPGPEEPAYPAWESFDPATDTADPPGRIEVVHDVPAAVMEGTVRVPGNAGQPPTEAPRPDPVEPRPTQVEGFRVQVFSSTDRQAAERVRGEAMAWWQTARNQSGAPSGLEAVVAYIQPYYRVRLGAYEFDGQAEQALAFVRQRFSDAFVVPDLVTVMK